MAERIEKAKLAAITLLILVGLLLSLSACAPAGDTVNHYYGDETNTTINYDVFQLVNSCNEMSVGDDLVLEDGSRLVRQESVCTFEPPKSGGSPW